MLFINPQGEEFEVADEHIQSAKDKGLEPAWDMVDPQGESYVVRNSHFEAATKKGFRPQAEKQAAQEAQSRFLEAGKDINPIVAGASGVLSSVPLSNLIPGQEALSEQSWENQPTAYGVGKGVGIAGGAFLSGGTSLPANIALGSAEGALQDKENRLRGAVVGGALGGAFHVGGEAIGKAANYLAPKVKNLAAGRAFESLNLGPNARGYALKSGRSQELGEKMLDEDLLRYGKKSAQESSEVARQRVGQDIGEFDIQHPVDVNYSHLQDRIKQIAIPMLENPNTADRGKSLLAYGNSLEKFKETHPDVDINNLDEGFKKWMQEKNVSLGKKANAYDVKSGLQERIASETPTHAEIGLTPQKKFSPGEEKVAELGKSKQETLDRIEKETGLTKKQISDYLSTRKALQEKSAKTTGRFVEGERAVPTEQLRQEKKQFADAFAKEGFNPRESSIKGKELYGVYKGAMRDNVAKQYGPEAVQEFDKLNKDYSLLKTISEAQLKNLGKKGSSAVGAMEMTGAAAGGIAGGAVGGTLGAATGAVLRKLAKYGNVAGAKFGNNLSKVLESSSKDPGYVLRLFKNYPTLDALITAIEGD